MQPAAEKYAETIKSSVAFLIARALDAREMSAADVVPRVSGAVEKYLLAHEPAPQHADVKAFIDELHADDLCLILACERGDEKAWEDLVANFDSTVRSAARKIASNNEDAEDLASSIWAELYGLRVDAEGNKKSKLAYYSGKGSLGGWLRAVVSQLAIDQFRKQAKMVQVEEDREFENLANAASENAGNNGFVAHTEDPENLLSERRTASDITGALQQSIAALEDEDRLMIKLYYFEGSKLKEIAAFFGFHEATASRRLVRIQQDIRKNVERSLQRDHGWTDAEIKKYLAESAAKLGISFEQMLKILTIAALVQEFYR